MAAFTVLAAIFSVPGVSVFPKFHSLRAAPGRAIAFLAGLILHVDTEGGPCDRVVRDADGVDAPSAHGFRTDPESAGADDATDHIHLVVLISHSGRHNAQGG